MNGKMPGAFQVKQQKGSGVSGGVGAGSRVIRVEVSGPCRSLSRLRILFWVEGKSGEDSKKRSGASGLRFTRVTGCCAESRMEAESYWEAIAREI